VDLGWESHPLYNIFSIVPGGEDRQAVDHLGIVPWWGHPDLHIEFFRPLTALTHMADYVLWPNLVPMQHLHSLIWFALAVALVALLYRRLHGVTVLAGLAALLFALEDAHHMPAGWLANRNALIALCFGTGALLAHIRWRTEGSGWYGALAVALLAVGQTAGEATLGALAYLVAWQLTMDRGSWWRRLVPLLPYLVVIIAWRAVYTALGYAVTGSGLYIDPAVQPWLFAKALVVRWPFMMASQWLQIQGNLWTMLTAQQHLMLAGVTGLLCAALLLLAWPVLRTQPLARFWAVGMSLAVIPLAAAFPMDRLLIFAGIGAFGLMAMLADDAGWLSPNREGVPRRRRWATGGLLLLHGPIAALLLLNGVLGLPLFHKMFALGSNDAPADPAVEGQVFLYLQGNEFTTAFTRLIRMVDGGKPAPRRVAQLSSLQVAKRVTRVDRRTLLFEIEGGMFQLQFDRLMRPADPPFAAGDRIRRPDFTTEVVEVTPDGRPLKVRFTFKQSLDHSDYRWLSFRNARLEEWPLPYVGDSVQLEAVSIIELLFKPGKK